MCKGLEFFHVFTGCDAVQSFYKVRKAKFCTCWLAQSKAGEHCPISLINLATVQWTSKWINLIRGATLSMKLVSTKQAPLKTRRTDHVTSTPNVNIWMLGPSPSRILQHINRACIQAGYFWKLHEIETWPNRMGL